MRQRANKRARPQPPGFFTGSRGCGCCQPPPPPPPPRSPYGYYYRRGDIQRSPCDWFCQNADGDFTGELPAYRWYFEVDSFEDVTSVPSPCESSTASQCENSNGTFAVQFDGSTYETVSVPNPIDPTKPTNFVYRYCNYQSPMFQAVYKGTDLYPLLQCAPCFLTGLAWYLTLSRIDRTNPDSTVDIFTGATLTLASPGVPLGRDMGRWGIGSPASGQPGGGPFNCSGNNVLTLIAAEWGYGVGSWFFDGPQCCTGAPNAIEIVPI